MKNYQYTVMDSSGLHARPATMIAACLMGHKSTAVVAVGDHIVDGKDVLALMSLYAKAGDELLFSIDGEDEEETITDLKNVLKKL